MAPFAPLHPRARASADAPLRLVVVTTGNGSVLPAWRPRQGGDWLPHGAELAGSTSEILAPLLERHAESTLLLDGIDLGAVKDASGDVMGSVSHNGHQAIFTGRYQEGESYDGPGNAEGIYPGGPSVDQIIADAIGSSAPVHSLALSLDRQRFADGRHVISYAEDGTPVLPMSESEVIHRTLFEGAVSDDAPDRDALRRARLLGHTQAELDTLARSSLPSSDVRRLEQHRSFVADLRARASVSSRSCIVPPVPEDTTRQARSINHQKLIAQAFACDRTRVVSYVVTGESRSSGWDGPFGGHHGVSHATRGSVDAVYEMIRIKQQEAEWVAGLVDELKAMPEGDGSVFDSTVIVWGTTMGHGGQHTEWGAPWTILQGSRGPWEMGRYLRLLDGPQHTVEEWGSRSSAFGHELG
ncbi:MAG: DUF1552 domain-containing protein, partial [Myxococcota bacterium]